MENGVLWTLFDGLGVHMSWIEEIVITSLSLEQTKLVNSLAPGRFQWNFVWIIFKLISVIGGRDITSEIVLRWISLDLSDDKSTLVQVMAWCCQATSHYPSQWWPRSLSPHGVIRPNELRANKLINIFSTISITSIIMKTVLYSCLVNSLTMIFLFFL